MTIIYWKFRKQSILWNSRPQILRARHRQILKARHRQQELQASFKELDLIEVFISGFLQKWFIISPLFKLWGIRKFHSYFSVCNYDSKFKWPWWSVTGRFWVSVPSFSYDPVYASTLMIKVKDATIMRCAEPVRW